jgi:uncharacterized protein (TIGR00369 family)
MKARLQTILDAYRTFGDSRVEAASAGHVRLRKIIDEQHLRRGGTVAGPTLMMLADATVYLALQTHGDLLAAVTSQLNIHFLRKPAACDLIAEGRILRLGRTLAVAEALLYSELAPGDEQLVAHATVTYALRPSGGD